MDTKRWSCFAALCCAMWCFHASQTVDAILGSAMITSVNAMRKIQQQMAGIGGNYPSGTALTSLSIIGIDLGTNKVFDIRNVYSYSSTMYKQRAVKFVTEQNGYGDVHAEFNGSPVVCTGLASARRKLCTVDASRRPWNGRFTVWAWSRYGGKTSAGFQMAANAVCQTAGLEGDNCNQDIDECTKYKGRRICAWKDGCVNNYGSYTCRCPSGYQVSKSDFRKCDALCQTAGLEGDNCNQDINECTKYKGRRICAWKDGCVNNYGSYTCRCPSGYQVSKSDFRNCDALLPKITSKSQLFTVRYLQSVSLPCQYEGPLIAARSWYKDGQLVYSQTTSGARVLNSVKQRYSIGGNGTLTISPAKFADMGVFTCQVQTTGIKKRLAHLVKIETVPILGIQFLASGQYYAAKNYKVNDTVVIECQALSLPPGTQMWKHADGSPIVMSSKFSLISGQLPKFPAGAVYSRLQINNAGLSDAGPYTCWAGNTLGSATKTVTIAFQE